ncbi:hypothetical protein [Lentzea kentuckyensis]|uniref:hypothetical protein n=1 Tax=Lentzea kentuckyensis TaxID=360086 RepID=UPI000A383547|nr:hypothetical protein [Lentzea kentuckyensis]
MKDFTAELEQVFGVAPSRETGLLIDRFDDTGIGGGVGRPTICRAAGERLCIGCVTRASVCRASVCICRASVPEAAFSICIAPFGDPSVSPCRVGWCGTTRVAVPA